MKNVDGKTVICDNIDGITVIANLVRPPIGTTWFISTKAVADQCGHIHTFDQVLELSKDKWKKVWKETIWEKDEMSVRV